MFLVVKRGRLKPSPSSEWVVVRAIAGNNKKTDLTDRFFYCSYPLERGPLLIGVYNRIGKRFGGPDGIRTRDLGLDRAAC